MSRASLNFSFFDDLKLICVRRSEGECLVPCPFASIGFTAGLRKRFYDTVPCGVRLRPVLRWRHREEYKHHDHGEPDIDLDRTDRDAYN